MFDQLVDVRGQLLANRMVAQRCQQYQFEFDFEAFVDPDHGDIRVVAGPTTAGLIVPKTLARKAAALLRPASVPIYSVGSALWVFVTEGLPDDLPAHRLPFSSLYRCGAVALLSPSLLVLPTPGIRRRCWTSVPHGPARPPIRDVATAVVLAASV